MSRRKKDPLRALTQQEREYLERKSRSASEAAGIVARAKALLAVADGNNYKEAAQLAGRKSNDAVSQLVSRFNTEGVTALVPRHAGGPEIKYGPEQREMILAEARRKPDPERDGTNTWSLTTLQRSLKKQELPRISTHTIFKVLKEAGFNWQKHRSWCETGTAWRKRKGTWVLVRDPDTEAKKS
jgi:transposase